MFAVIKTGGKQYFVKPGSVIKVEKLDVEENEEFVLPDVLWASKGGDGFAKVSVRVLEQCRDQKIIVFKKRRRKNYRRKNGHRQYLTVLRVLDIEMAS